MRGAGGIDEDLANSARSNGKKVGPVSPIDGFRPDQLEEGFMNDRGWLEQMIGLFPPHLKRRDSAELMVDLGVEILASQDGIGSTRPQPLEDPSDISHANDNTHNRRRRSRVL